jgi:hypothetical protein
MTLNDVWLSTRADTVIPTHRTDMQAHKMQNTHWAYLISRYIHITTASLATANVRCCNL